VSVPPRARAALNRYLVNSGRRAALALSGPAPRGRSRRVSRSHRSPDPPKAPNAQTLRVPFSWMRSGLSPGGRRPRGSSG